jgi:hypothetical protein
MADEEERCITLRATGGLSYVIRTSTPSVTVDLRRFDVRAIQGFAAWLRCSLDELPRIMTETTSCMTTTEMSQREWAEFLYAPFGHDDCVNVLCPLRQHETPWSAAKLFREVAGLVMTQECRVLPEPRLLRIARLCMQGIDMYKACDVFGVSVCPMNA